MPRNNAPSDDKKGLTIGGAKVVADAPVSDGSVALDITNFRKINGNILDSTFRLMPLIPNQWRGSAQPLALSTGVIGLFFVSMEGGVPEILVLTNDQGGGSVWRYTPWTRASGGTSPGLEAVTRYTGIAASTVVSVQGALQFPPQAVTIGDRVYFTFGDGGPLWTWDRYRLRSFGYASRPSPPSCVGPSRGSSANSGGFSAAGRVGTIDGSFTATTNAAVGGVDAMERRYALVWENVDGAYSPMSPLGGQVSMRIQLADPGVTEMEALRRRFRVTGTAPGPIGTRARILLATANLSRLPPGDDGRPRFHTRIPNNVPNVELVDDKPDGELGATWVERGFAPHGAFLLWTHGAVLFLGNTEGHPCRIWWSEVGPYGAIPESFIVYHWMDVFPSTGPMTAGRSYRLGETTVSLIWKERALHVLGGEYPVWAAPGTLHDKAGTPGPDCIVSAADGSLVWYGNGTLWHLDRENGAVTDVGKHLRKWLNRINTHLARMGTSWFDPVSGEACIALPIDDDTGNTFVFAWDAEERGFRFRDDGITYRCACQIPGLDLVLVGGAYNSIETIWALDRGHPGYTVTAPTATYTSGWLAVAQGPNMHQPALISDTIFVQEERSSGTATISLYTDWDGETAKETNTIDVHHPDDDNVTYYGSATIGTSKWRTRRPFAQFSTLQSEVHAAVFSVKVTTTSPLALLTADAYGFLRDAPGTHTPRREGTNV